MALQARRRNMIEGRLHRPLGPSTPESELSNLRENNGKPGSITIYVECRLSQKPGSVDRTLGTYCAPYAETMTFVGMVFFRYIGCTYSLVTLALQLFKKAS